VETEVFIPISSEACERFAQNKFAIGGIIIL
jgi:hypothetical protein